MEIEQAKKYSSKVKSVFSTPEGRELFTRINGGANDIEPNYEAVLLTYEALGLEPGKLTYIKQLLTAGEAQKAHSAKVIDEYTREQILNFINMKTENLATLVAELNEDDRAEFIAHLAVEGVIATLTPVCPLFIEDVAVKRTIIHLQSRSMIDKIRYKY